MPKWKNINWLLVATGFTVVYFGIFFWWIGFGRITRYPATGSLNEIGDFIAGVFQPIAVIWLVAAVLIQRQELVDTREQFKEMSDATKSQLDEIATQSITLQKQHKLAEESARRTYRLNLFQERYKIYTDFIEFGEQHKSNHFDESYLEMVELAVRARFVFGEDIQEWFDSISEAIYELTADRQDSLKFHMDDSGNECFTFKTVEDEKRCNGLEGWIWEQFSLPEDRSDRFYASMKISDN